MIFADTQPSVDYFLNNHGYPITPLGTLLYFLYRAAVTFYGAATEVYKKMIEPLALAHMNYLEETAQAQSTIAEAQKSLAFAQDKLVRSQDNIQSMLEEANDTKKAMASILEQICGGQKDLKETAVCKFGQECKTQENR